jgi:hypothetical protein
MCVKKKILHASVYVDRGEIVAHLVGLKDVRIVSYARRGPVDEVIIEVSVPFHGPFDTFRGRHAGGLQGLHMNGWHSDYLSLRECLMRDYEPTSHQKALPSDPESAKTSDPPAVDDLRGAASASPLPPASSPGWPVSARMSERGSRPQRPRPPSKVRRGLIVAAALMGSVTGLFVGVGASSSAGAAQSVFTSSSRGRFAYAGEAPNARSGPAAGGSLGTVGNVAKSSFTLTTSAGQDVTVDEESSTKYQRGTTSASKSAVTKGAHVLVLGTVSSTTIKATQVVVQKSGGSSEPSTAASVVPFRKGAAATSKQVGQIPAGYSQGSGTIVSGTTANKATEAALAAYPGGIVDRVVKLSNGEFEVHNIGVNWPHHIFVNQGFKVVGAD